MEDFTQDAGVHRPGGSFRDGELPEPHDNASDAGGRWRSPRYG